ncbi:flagellar basal body rod protein FlgC [Gynuella sunshinyii]|uniref:Flagellar basal-body rod protein FlgC n=1 Tax=Gynuella sunshinyii YC6258 TaxID=1445510 RepID=A0A0C5VHC5_9GAMM|nr:flagellar basal body rod protein FlgC [Gynuella sunshinyii]AJQ92718.1 flagellar basal body rod protein [Gynuella sunshinyii YC6258]
MADFKAFEISSAGMALEKLRLDLAAMNIANMNTATRVGEGYHPRHIETSLISQTGFEDFMQSLDVSQLVAVREGDTRQVYEPNHPLANQEGMVEYPDIKPLTEMMTLMTAIRSYEANARAFNASKLLVDEALKLGK